MKTQSSFFGLLCIVVGLAIFLLSIGSLLVKGAIALAGLALINFGLKLQGSMPLQYQMYRWFNRSQFKGW